MRRALGGKAGRLVSQAAFTKADRPAPSHPLHHNLPATPRPQLTCPRVAPRRSGYTAKVAGTEQGVTEPEATFSACFGSAFLMWHPVHC